jgi:hypothetical protein
MRSTEPACFRSCSWYLWKGICFRSCSWCLWKALGEEGVHGLGSMGVWSCGAKVLEYWMISSLNIKLYLCYEFRRTWNVPLMLLQRSWWAGFNGIYLVRFGFRMCQILILKWFCSWKLKWIPKKPGFGRKNQLRMW